MVKTKLYLLIILLTPVLFSAQNRVILNNNIFLVINNSCAVVVDNANSNAITVTGTGGNILSEGEFNRVKWNVGANTGNYTVPFTTTNNPIFVKIPLAVNITSAGVGANASIIFSTYETTTDLNTPYPSDVTNMSSSCSSGNELETVDRFWIIDAQNYTTKPTPIINFTYNDAANEIGATNTVIESRLKAERFNSGINSWQTPLKLAGISNSVTNNVANAAIAPADFYRSWSLVDTNSFIIPKLVTKAICLGDSVLINGNYYFSSGTYTNFISAALYCDTLLTTNVNMHAQPIANFTFSNTCINAQNNVFDASATTIAVGTNTLYTWSFGDATTANGVVLTHTYTNVGNYNVTLVVTSNNGCKDSITGTLDVFPKPNIDFVASSVCFKTATNFTANTLQGSITVTNWNWDFNNTISSFEANGQSVALTYTTAGSQTVALVAVTNNGCTDTLKKTVYVDYLPVPSFTVDKPKGCPEHCVTFTDLTLPVTLPSVNATWKWEFGDGTSQIANAGKPQSHCYNNTSSNKLNIYDVKLTVTTSGGCSDTIRKNSFITVYPTPIANFTVDPLEADLFNPVINFTNLSQDYTQFWWNFGDGSNEDSFHINPSYTYSSVNPNIYTTSLWVTNQYGCAASAVLNVEIKPLFTFYIPNAFTPGNEDNLNDTFNGIGNGIAKYEMWIYDRWGEKIFYTNDLNKGWDGLVQNKGKFGEEKLDVYVWKVILKDIFGKTHDYIGHVTLLK